MVCAADFVTCCKSNVSVLIFASCTAVVRDRESNNQTPPRKCWSIFHKQENYLSQYNSLTKPV